MVSIYLIQAQATPLESGLRNEKWYLPLGLLSITAFLKENGFSDVRIFDADHDPLDEIISRLEQDKPNIVGVNSNVFNWKMFDRVVEVAKGVGSLVVAGGQAATPIQKRILDANVNIDAVVSYDGEYPMLEVARRTLAASTKKPSLTGIPFLAYRDHLGNVAGGQSSSDRIIRINRGSAQYSNLTDLSRLSTLDRRINGFDFDRYLRSWNRPDIDPNRIATSMYMQKGCGQTCTFCARVDKELRQRSPRQAYDELKSLATEGVNYVYVVDDTFAADINYLRALKAEYDNRGKIQIKLWAFVDARDVSKESVTLMSELGLEKALVGIESGEKLRMKNGKPYSDAFLLEKMVLLGNAGIKVEDSYVLGLAGETWESLNETYILSQRVARVVKTEGTAFNIMTPLIGSPDWNRLMKNPEMTRKYARGYRFDINELREDYSRNFCNVDPNISLPKLRAG